ncbi:MAG: hypothetical protein IT429_06800 [Gemmataceae bacterium]|nr:hypothetical protein [Gemmataceae bacterium]
MLDTFPQSGGITTLDALLMGIPVVTLLGQRVPGRVSASLLTTLGLSGLVAETPDEYVGIAARLAADLDRLARERATIRDRLLSSPLGDARQYAGAVEDVYRDLWRRWCAAQEPVVPTDRGNSPPAHVIPSGAGTSPHTHVIPSRARHERSRGISVRDCPGRDPSTQSQAPSLGMTREGSQAPVPGVAGKKTRASLPGMAGEGARAPAPEAADASSDVQRGAGGEGR